MRIVIEINHPAHVNFFRNPIKLLESRGHKVRVTSRDKDCTLALLDDLGIPHLCLTQARRANIVSRLSELAYRNHALYHHLKDFQADVVTGVGGTAAAQTAIAARCPSVVFYDTEDAKLQNAITYPFATRVVVPQCYYGWTPKSRTLRYQGYHEMSYLAPRYFQPDRCIAMDNGLAENGDTFLIRLVAWGATHDFGLKGWSAETLRGVVKALTKRGRVLISSETPLPNEFAEFSYSGAPSAIHHVMGHCRLVLGESATMASEAVAMGVPAIYAAPSPRGYVSDQQNRYGMAAFIAEPSAQSITSQIEHFLGVARTELEKQHLRLLNDSVDLPEFVTDTLISIAR